MMLSETSGGQTMTHKNRFTTKKIVLVGVLAALTFVGSALRIKVPASLFGTSAFHLGNILCALSGILLGPWLGGLAAGLGSAIYDMFDPYYISECWLTFIMKFAYGMAAGLIIRSGKKDWDYAKALIATICGALTYALLYLAKTFFYGGLLINGLTVDAALLVVVSKLPATTFNIMVAVIASPLLAMALKKALKRNHLLP